MDMQTQRALAHPTRIAILGYLMQREGGEGVDESELVGSLGLMKTKVEYHATVLFDAGLIVRTYSRETGTDEHSTVLIAASE